MKRIRHHPNHSSPPWTIVARSRRFGGAQPGFRRFQRRREGLAEALEICALAPLRVRRGIADRGTTVAVPRSAGAIEDDAREGAASGSTSTKRNSTSRTTGARARPTGSIAAAVHESPHTPSRHGNDIAAPPSKARPSKTPPSPSRITVERSAPANSRRHDVSPPRTGCGRCRAIRAHAAVWHATAPGARSRPRRRARRAPPPSPAATSRRRGRRVVSPTPPWPSRRCVSGAGGGRRRVSTAARALVDLVGNASATPSGARPSRSRSPGASGGRHLDAAPSPPAARRRLRRIACCSRLRFCSPAPLQTEEIGRPLTGAGRAAPVRTRARASPPAERASAGGLCHHVALAREWTPMLDPAPI